MAATIRYRIRNNTDLRDAPLEFASERTARRAWRDIRPCPGAGNAYWAAFEERCSKCGGWHDADAIGACPGYDPLGDVTEDEILETLAAW